MTATSPADGRLTNWEVVTPPLPARVLYLAVGDERPGGLHCPDPTRESLQAGLGDGAYDAVVAPDLARWVQLAGGLDVLLAAVGRALVPGGWLHLGSDNPRFPLRRAAGGSTPPARLRGACRRRGWCVRDEFLVFPHAQRPAFYVPSARRVELDHFIGHLAFPYTESSGRVGAMLQLRVLRAGALFARRAPHRLRVALAPSYAVVLTTGGEP